MSKPVSALLAESANFRQILELRPCDALQPLIEIRISSWYADANDPESPQVQFQTLAAPEALSELRNALEIVLARSAGWPEQEGR